jgi:hypothetical protein
MGYRNVYYDPLHSIIHIWSWDENGERTKFSTSYEPYLYIESENGTDARSIFNTPLKKIPFRNRKARNTYVEETPIKRLFYNLPVDQQYLLDTFKDEVDKPEFGNQPLKIYYLDIETYATDHFSTPEDATDPINLITIFDSKSQKIYTRGCKAYHNTDDDENYIKCKDEPDLLKIFFK